MLFARLFQAICYSLCLIFFFIVFFFFYFIFTFFEFLFRFYLFVCLFSLSSFLFLVLFCFFNFCFLSLTFHFFYYFSFVLLFFFSFLFFLSVFGRPRSFGIPKTSSGPSNPEIHSLLTFMSLRSNSDERYTNACATSVQVGDYRNRPLKTVTKSVKVSVNFLVVWSPCHQPVTLNP